MTRTLRIGAFALLAAAALALSGCSGAAEGDTVADASPSETELRGSLTVAAAASLQPAFEELTAEFSREHPGVTFENLTFDGSSVLAAQIIGGAPVDVFASADEANMQKVQEEDLVAADPVPFAKSTLQIAVAPGNPLGIASLADLADGANGANGANGADGKPPIVVQCAAEVPCGTAANTLLANAGVTLTPASEEQNVTAVLSKVANGEADAGFVYRSDVLRSDGAVDGIDIPGASEAAGLYVAAPIEGSASPDAALAFAEFLRSADAQDVFDRLGFDAP